MVVGGGGSCATFRTFRSFRLPRLRQMRQGILTTRKEWRFKRQEFQAGFGRMAAFEASSPLLKAEGEKNQC